MAASTKHTLNSTLYFDYQATTPVDEAVLAAMLPYFRELYGNADSRHTHGQTAAAAIDLARDRVRDLVGAASPAEVAFTSGATESNALVMRFAFMGDKPGHLITSAVEHPSILGPAAELERWGHEVSYLPVDKNGLVDPADVRALMRPHTRLVSVMHANNEIGTIQPIAEIAAICREEGVLMHSDLTQTAGILDVDVRALNVDVASLSAHKFYGPKGVGALYVRQSCGLRVRPGRGEKGLRAGTLNVPGIVGMGVAADLARTRRTADAAYVSALRVRFARELLDAVPEAFANGHPTARIPGNLSVTFPGIEADSVLRATPDIGLAMGSACTSGRSDPSHVLLAIGLSRALSRSTLRIGFGRGTTWEECQQCLSRLIPFLLPARQSVY